MFENYDIYTGRVTYNNIQFTFVFNKDKLILIPNSSEYTYINSINISDFFKEKNLTQPDKRYLIGICNETLNNIVFLIDRYCDYSSFNNIVHINVSGYIIFFRNEYLISKINFSCPEINYIHPSNQALSTKLIFDSNNKVQFIEIIPQDKNNITSQKQTFFFEHKEITSYFSIYAGIKPEIHKSPFNLNSLLIFEFEPSDNYDFIMQLCILAWSFICFLCYRNNIYLNNIDLYGLYKSNKYIKVASLHLKEPNENHENTPLTHGRYIKQKYISGYEGKILSDIASDTIYMRHFPESFIAGKSISTGRFIIIIAAFEWEFRKLYPDGVERSEKTKELEDTVSKEIQNLIDNNTGKIKEKYKFLKKLIKSDSLQNKIIYVGKILSNILDPFKNQLYCQYENMTYDEIGKRISDQRNNFAHGNLDKDFIEIALLDLLFIEYMIYAIQLKYYGLDDVNIKKSINDLFRCNISF